MADCALNKNSYSSIIDFTEPNHYHYQNNACIQTGTMSRFNVSVVVRDRVTKQCLQATMFWEERKVHAARNMTAQPYRQAKRSDLVNINDNNNNKFL